MPTVNPTLLPVENEIMRVLHSYGGPLTYKQFRETHFRGSNEFRLCAQLRELQSQGLVKLTTRNGGLFVQITPFGKQIVEGIACG